MMSTAKLLVWVFLFSYLKDGVDSTFLNMITTCSLLDEKEWKWLNQTKFECTHKHKGDNKVDYEVNGLEFCQCMNGIFDVFENCKKKVLCHSIIENVKNETDGYVEEIPSQSPDQDPPFETPTTITTTSMPEIVATQEPPTTAATTVGTTGTMPKTQNKQQNTIPESTKQCQNTTLLIIFLVVGWALCLFFLALHYEPFKARVNIAYRSLLTCFANLRSAMRNFFSHSQLETKVKVNDQLESNDEQESFITN